MNTKQSFTESSSDYMISNSSIANLINKTEYWSINYQFHHSIEYQLMNYWFWYQLITTSTNE